MGLFDALPLGARTASNRLLFGPIVTNLGDDDRRFTERHAAFYERRARGGCGIVVTEDASVHPSDWPYERAPLAERCGPGWERIVAACAPHGSLVIASLNHAGGQGSSAYSQAPLWAPSRVPEVNTREVPKWMEDDDIHAVIEGFGAAAQLAIAAGCDGVEVNAGQHSLVRQFLSGLTNQRDDVWGGDRMEFARRVIAAVRPHTPVVGLRLSCDELAPWAGITPEAAPALAAELVALGVDYLVVTRGSIFSVDKTRPDFHEPPMFNLELCRAVKAAVGDVPVVLQGSVVDAADAARAIDEGACDAVEMTRAQLADPDLARTVAAGGRPRPCVRCNQNCLVRDARNPIITCIAEPSTGHETDDPDWYQPASRSRTVLVIGAGPAGLETARVAARRGHRVEVVERAAGAGGAAATSGPAAPIVEWLVEECERAGVQLRTGTREDTAALARHAAHAGSVVVQCTGGQPGRRTYAIAEGAVVVDVETWRAGAASLPDEGPVAILDPIGGPIAIAAAEELGDRAVLITPDHIAGNELSRSGDLAPANTRLAQRGVHIERRAIVRRIEPGAVVVEDRFSGELRSVPAVAVLDCGFRLPTDPIEGAHLQAGDCVAPRTVLEAILEGRRAACDVDTVT